MNREIARLTKRLRLGRPIVSYPVTLTSRAINGKQVHFCTSAENDPVQQKHRKGKFYETVQLNALAALFPKGGTFVDIGAHVGNHSLFAALFMDAGTIIPIEPNPAAYRLLVQNMLVNGVTDLVDLGKLGCAAGANAAEGYAIKVNRNKPAATRLKTKGGKVSVVRGDALLDGVTPDMIKINTPGMEMEVLDGLSGVFARCTPVLLIEVAAANDVAFNDWASTSGYTVAATTKRNRNSLNYMLTSKAAKKTVAKKTAGKKVTTPTTSTTRKTTTSKAKTSAATKTTAAKPKTTTARKTTTKPKTTKPVLAKTL